MMTGGDASEVEGRPMDDDEQSELFGLWIVVGTGGNDGKFDDGMVSEVAFGCCAEVVEDGGRTVV